MVSKIRFFLNHSKETAGGVLILLYFLTVWGMSCRSVALFTICQLLWVIQVKKEKEERRNRTILKELIAYVKEFRIRYQKVRHVEIAKEEAWYHGIYSFSLDSGIHPLLERFLLICDYLDESMGKGDSEFLSLIEAIGEDAKEDFSRSQQYQYEFSGAMLLIWGAMLAIKPIESWAVQNVSELRAYYDGALGELLTITAFGCLFLSWYGVLVLRYPLYRPISYEDTIWNRIFQIPLFNKYIILYMNMRKEYCSYVHRLLEYAGYPLPFPQFLALQMCTIAFVLLETVLLLCGTGIFMIPACIVFIIAAALGSFFPYILVLIAWSELKEKKEQEILWYYQLMGFIKEGANISSEQILQWLLKGSYYYRAYIQGSLAYSEFLGESGMMELWEETDDASFVRLMEMLSVCDISPAKEVFSGAAEEAQYLKEQFRIYRKQKNRIKILLGHGAAFAPCAVIVMTHLMIPFVLEGLRQLTMYAVGMQEFW